MSNYETCDTCKFKGGEIASHNGPVLFACRRYPVPTAVGNYDWCGEWKKKDD
jgi:hypothetical protein